MHEIVLYDGQLHDVLGQGVDAGIDAPSLRVATQKVKRQWSTLEVNVHFKDKKSVKFFTNPCLRYKNAKT